MKKYYLLLSLGVSITIISCKKNDTAATATVCKVATIIDNPDSANSVINTLSYNASGKLVKSFPVNSGKPQSGFYTTYDYAATTITEKYFNITTNALLSTTVFTLGGNGYASSSTITSAGHNPVTYTYEYNADGYLTKESYTTSNNGSYVFTFSYVSGNCTSEMEIHNNPPSQDTIVYTNEYYTDKITSVNATGYYPTGKPNTNLLKKITQVTGISSGAAVTTDQFTYTFDGNNNVISQLDNTTDIFNGNTIKSASKTNYTYSCN